MIGVNGASAFRSNSESGIGQLTITIPCRLESLDADLRGFVDTGARWSIIPGDIAQEAGLDLEGPGLGRATIHTRLGSFNGHLERSVLRLPTDWGEPLLVDATWLICPDWCGPVVLGWTGCLDRFQWGIQPEEGRFYFGPL